MYFISYRVMCFASSRVLCFASSIVLCFADLQSLVFYKKYTTWTLVMVSCELNGKWLHNVVFQCHIRVFLFKVPVTQNLYHGCDRSLDLVVSLIMILTFHTRKSNPSRDQGTLTKLGENKYHIISIFHLTPSIELIPLVIEVCIFYYYFLINKLNVILC